ncbi:uncharacterized protein TNCV_3676241 [Trichonephila clavipes]|nr:uncharacterized protein TNCV_3676241 [Trichonephila clavipes]
MREPATPCFVNLSTNEWFSGKATASGTVGLSRLHFEFLTDQDRRLDRKSTHTEKRTVTMYVQVFLLSVLAVGGVMAFKGFDDNFVGYVLEANACVSESGNPSLCKKYVGCASKLPKPVISITLFSHSLVF